MMDEKKAEEVLKWARGQQVSYHGWWLLPMVLTGLVLARIIAVLAGKTL